MDERKIRIPWLVGLTVTLTIPHIYLSSTRYMARTQVYHDVSNDEPSFVIWPVAATNKKPIPLAWMRIR